MSHALRAVLFFIPVRLLIFVVLLRWGWCAVRDRNTGSQLLMSLVSAVWVVAELRHDKVI